MAWRLGRRMRFSHVRRIDETAAGSVVVEHRRGDGRIARMVSAAQMDPPAWLTNGGIASRPKNSHHEGAKQSRGIF